MTAIPLQHPAASRHDLRLRLVSLIDRLIGALDAIDGDPDFEDSGDDEPSLAFQEARSWESQDNVIRLSPIGGGHFTDLEDDGDDLEPSLCGIVFGRGSEDDLEGEHDGREPELGQ